MIQGVFGIVLFLDLMMFNAFKNDLEGVKEHNIIGDHNY